MALTAALALAAATARAEPPFLTLSLEEDPTSLDWHRTRSSSDRFILSFLMRGLMKTDPKGEPVCDLCETHQRSADGTTHTFTLKKDVTWSDGRKLEARHFVDSFERLLDPAHDFPGADDYRAIKNATANPDTQKERPPLGVSAPDKHTVKIELEHPSARFLERLTLPPAYPIRKEFAKDTQKDDGVGMAQMAVLGPYFVAAWEKGERVVIEGNPEFKGERPVYRVEFVLGRPGQMLERFKAGKLDVLSDPTTDVIMQHRELKVQVSPYWATRSLLFNHRRQVLSDAGLRKAILYAIDRSEIPSVAKNGERSATGLIPPGLRGHRGEALLKANLSRAKAERHRAVEWPRWVNLSLLIRDTEADRRIADWLEAELAAIHVRARVLSAPSRTFYRALEQGDFDMALHTWTFRTSSPLDMLETFKSEHPRNLSGWNNSAFDQLFEQARREKNPAAFADSLDQALRILESDAVGAIPLGYPSHPFLLGRRVKSFAITPFGDPDLVRISLKAARPAPSASPAN